MTSRNDSNGFIDRYFGLSRAGATIGGEIHGGVTTYMTMAYILFVNPLILGNAIKIEGVNMFGELLTATALAAALGTLMMGLVARYPFALAPGMGLNAYFTYTVVLGHGIPWQTALGAVFVSGVLFLVLSVVGVREAIINAIPRELRIATAVGIGLFLAIIGANNCGLIAAHPATKLTLGDMTSPSVLLASLGILVTAVLLVRKVTGAILIGIVVVTVVAIATNAPVFADGKPFSGFPGGVIQAPMWPTHLLLELDIGSAIKLGGLSIVFIFVFVDLFDTAGTLLGLADKAGVIDEAGHMPRASAAFAADATATIAGSLLGTSTTTSYVESAAGIEAGGRTGLTAVVVAILFAASTVLWPVASILPPSATAPALIVIGAMMMFGVGRIDWSDHGVAIPSFLTIIGMPLTFSIANGISFGIVSYAAINLVAGRARRVHWVVYVLAVLLVARYAWLGAA